MARRTMTLFVGLMASVGLVAACGGGEATPTPAAAAPPGGGTALTITAKDIAFAPPVMAAPAGIPLDITFDQQDAGIPHNIALYGDAQFTTKLYEGEIVTGPATLQASIPGLIPGVYQFRCTVHPNMTAELDVGG